MRRGSGLFYDIQCLVVPRVKRKSKRFVITPSFEFGLNPLGENDHGGPLNEGQTFDLKPTQKNRTFEDKTVF